MNGVLRCLLQAALLAGAAAWTAGAHAQSRGELLYSTHCITCHSAQMHWRERRQATDWLSLQSQVRRWQSVAALDWSDEDIVEVTRYLNDTIYRFPAPSKTSASGLAPGAALTGR